MKGRRRRLIDQIRSTLIFFFVFVYLLTSVTSAFAAPQGGVVTSGNASITSAGTTTTIQQFTDKAILNWQSFGINPNELVRFLQPGASSIALNRVIGTDPSVILGALRANGNVWLINPNGILFGAGAQVNVGGLLASTLNIKDQDFLNGKYVFTQDVNHALSSIVNQGNIQALDHGYVVLLAPLVDNEGSIIANLGQVKLGGATEAVVNFDNQGYVNYVLNGNTVPKDVVMNNQALTPLLSQAVNNKNIVEAGSVTSNPDGSITLTGSEGLVMNGGTIQANGSVNQNAGSITLNSTQATVLAPNSVIQANGQGTNSNGGDIHILSQGNTVFAPGASLQAKGGDSGNGGFVDVSGDGNVYVNGSVDTSAPNGQTGTFLIDPANLTVTNAAAGGTQDPNVPNVLFGTADNGGNTVSVGRLQSQVSNILLQANNTITINDLAGGFAGGSITLQPNVSLTMQTTTGNITFANTANTITASGSGGITLNAGGAGTFGNLTTANGNISMTSGTTMSTGNLTATGSGSIGATSGGTMTLGNVSTTNGSITTNSTGNITLSNLSAANGNISATTTGNMTLGTLTASSGGSVTLNSGGTVINGGGPFNIVAGSSVITATSDIGSAGTHLTTNSGNQVQALSTTGGIYIDNTSANLSVLTGNAVAGPITLNNTGAVTSLTLTGGGTNDINVLYNGATKSWTYNGTTNVLNGNALGTSVSFNNISGPIVLGSVTASYLVLGTNGGSSITSDGVSNPNLTVPLGGQIFDAGAFGSAVTPITGNIGVFGSGILIFATAGAWLNNTGGATSFASVVTGGPEVINNAVAFLNLSLQFGGNDITVNDGVEGLTFTNATGILTGNVPSANLTIQAANNVILTSLTANTATIAAVTLDGNGASPNVTASSITLSSAFGMNTPGTPINTDTSTLTVNELNPFAGVMNVNNTVPLTSLSVMTHEENSTVTAPNGSLTFTAGTDVLNSSFPGGVALSMNNATGNLVLNAANQVNVGAGTATLIASGSITGDNTASLVTAGTATLTAGTNVGSVGTAMNTQVNTLNASTTNGLVNLNNTGAVTLNSIVAGGVGGNVTVSNTGGNLSVGTVTAGGSVSLTSPNSILDSTSNITSNNITLTALSGIGTPGTHINTTDTGSLTTSPTGAGATTNMTNTGTLTNLSVTTNNGDATVAATNGTLTFASASSLLNVPLNGTNVSVNNTNGNLLFDATHSVNVGASNVTLNASGSISAGAPTDITAGTATLTATSIVGFLSTAVSTLNATTTNSGVSDNNTGALTLGTISATHAGFGLINITAGGNMSIGTVTNTGFGSVFLTSSGAMLDSGSSISSGNTIFLSAANGVGSLVNPIHTVSTSVVASSNSTSGGTYLSNTGTLSALSITTPNADVNFVDTNGGTAAYSGATSLLNANLTGSSFVLQNSSGNIGFDATHSVSALSANLSASGSITESGVSTAITAPLGGASFHATNFGSAVAPIQMSVAQFSGTATNGGIYATNAGAFIFGTPTTASGAGDNIVVTATAGDMRVGRVTANGAGSITLAAPAGSILDFIGASNLNSSNITLSAANGIGTAGTAIGTTSTGSLTATTTGAGATIHLNNTGTLANLSVTTANSDATVAATNGTLTFAGATSLLNAPLNGTNVTFGNSNGNIGFDATHSVSVGASNVTLNASGSINPGAPTDITANTASLTTGLNVGGVGTPLNTNISTLNATTTNGLINVTNAGTLNVNSVTANGAGNNVNLTTSAVDMFVTSVAANGGNVNLTAQGSIYDPLPNIFAFGNASLTALTGVIGTSAGHLNVTVNGTLTLSAGGAQGGIALDLDGLVNGLATPSASIIMSSFPGGSTGYFNGICLFGCGGGSTPPQSVSSIVPPVVLASTPGVMDFSNTSYITSALQGAKPNSENGLIQPDDVLLVYSVPFFGETEVEVMHYTNFAKPNYQPDMPLKNEKVNQPKSTINGAESSPTPDDKQSNL